LLASLQAAATFDLANKAVAPLLFVDGTYHNLFRYTENSLDWLRYLRVTEPGHPLYRLFMENEQTIHRLMSLMDQFWEARDRLSAPRERGDRIAITQRGGAGTPHNLVPMNDDRYRFEHGARDRGESFLRLLADATGWAYEPEKWIWEDWRLTVFEKGQMDRLSIPKFEELMSKMPLSLAITAGRRVEYTLDPTDAFR